MKTIIVHRTNNSFGKKDASRVFTPEAEHLERLLGTIGHESERIGYDTTVEDYADKTQRAILAKPEIDTLAYFGHGWVSGLEFLQWWEIDKFIGRLVARNCQRVILFACSAAPPPKRAKACVAERICQCAAYRRKELVVIGHEVSGHATCNPRARVWRSRRTHVDTMAVLSHAIPLVNDLGEWRRTLKTDPYVRLLWPYVVTPQLHALTYREVVAMTQEIGR